MTQSNDPPRRTKTCWTCKRELLLHHFASKRHHICSRCRLPWTGQDTPKAARERYRSRRGVKLSSKRLAIQETRRCPRCKQTKPAIMFVSPRWRLCLACDHS